MRGVAAVGAGRHVRSGLLQREPAGGFDVLAGHPAELVGEMRGDDLPMWSASPSRPSTVCATVGGITSGYFANASFAIRVRVEPGDTPLTRIPRGLNSFAIQRVCPIRAAFVVE